MKAAVIVKRNSTIALAAVLVFCIAVGGRHVLEARLLTHMLVQMPLLIAGGALLTCLRPLAHSRQGPDLFRFWNHCDSHGMASMLTVLFCCAYWMVPNAIEHAVANPFAESIKFISLTCAGALLPGALSKSGMVFRILFTGNLTWMLVVAGLIYLQAPQRLCNSYLLDDQARTGIGLLITASFFPAWWCAVTVRHQHRSRKAVVALSRS